jgi:type I restriction enzyme M protein|tara:strand:- start:26 stop:625 length:600 start_codon:yes stop_codon:yes gene_type:complete
MPGDLQKISSKLWAAADQLNANSNLNSAQYSTPVLGVIFLKFADSKFEKAKEELEKKASSRRSIGSAAYRAKGILFLPDKARFSKLLKLQEGANIGKAINEAMVAIEAENLELKDILPKSYNLFENWMLIELLKIFNSIPMDIEGDAFGKIYEYFLGKFAMKEGQKGGEFFTPTSIVKLIVEIIEPYQGRIYDPVFGVN